MGVGGKFWDVLKPYARNEGFDYLRNQRVAVDLSFWIVQHETAIKSKYARNPHIRLTFFRTINLFAKFGAYPVFVVDGTPSPLKAQARMARFLRFSGVDLSASSVAEGVSADRNPAFQKCVKECVELLNFLGMPVLEAKSEAEALCAQLNRDGHVDACITADSDAFLFGAKRVIKSISPNSKEPFECYHMSDIEVGLGLKRNHLIAISLLVGNDHNLNGVQGIGLETALRFVQSCSEDEVLNRLRKIANGDTPLPPIAIESVDDPDPVPSKDECPAQARSSHCSFCGHPGNKRDHFKFSCKFCLTEDGEGCLKKPLGFKCNCSSCEWDQKEKEQKRHENWRIRVCKKIAMEPNFPKDEIIDLYLCDNHGNFSAEGGPYLSWGVPETELLVDFLTFYQNWQPSYIRQRLLPMLSTIYLREMSRTLEKSLLCGQYEFDSIHRIKIRYGYEYYVVKWKKSTLSGRSMICSDPIEEPDAQPDGCIEVEDSVDMLDEPDVPKVHIDDGCWFLLTDENKDLVRAAFSDKVDAFLQEKEKKESKRKSSSSRLESPKSKGAQLNITDFYRSTKSQTDTNRGEVSAKNVKTQEQGTSKERRNVSSPSVSKSVRRRLIFD